MEGATTSQPNPKVKLTMVDVRDKLIQGSYDNKLPYAIQRQDPVASRAWTEECTRLKALFKVDALETFGLTGHPKADLVFSKAWDLGHVDGYAAVVTHLKHLAELVK